MSVCVSLWFIEGVFMGEIKSTLDLIMERTRNLTMTEEEKRAFKEQELAGKAKGLVQRYLDGAVGEEKVMHEISLHQEEEGRIGHLVRLEAVSRIGLRKENAPILQLLERMGVAPGPMRGVVAGFQEKASQERDFRMKVLEDRLMEQGISGSAVIPNVEADENYRQIIETLEEDLRERLKAVSA